jgi:DNA-binding LacI/PurR family transcriptional regulator
MRRGKRIPQDVAVISRDDDPFLESTSPPVARYTLKPELLARRIARAIWELAEAGALPAAAIRLMPTFRPDESV